MNLYDKNYEKVRIFRNILLFSAQIAALIFIVPNQIDQEFYFYIHTVSHLIELRGYDMQNGQGSKETVIIIHKYHRLYMDRYRLLSNKLEEEDEEKMKGKRESKSFVMDKD